MIDMLMNPPLPPRLRQLVDNFFVSVGQGVNSFVLAKARSHELQRLYEKSDAELAAMGLKRTDIPRHVFRDLFD